MLSAQCAIGYCPAVDDAGISVCHVVGEVLSCNVLEFSSIQWHEGNVHPVAREHCVSSFEYSTDHKDYQVLFAI
jgi:hypothetical protein